VDIVWICYDEVFYEVIEHFEQPDEDEHPLVFDGTLDMNEWMEKHIA
jgi:hypothetical protein